MSGLLGGGGGGGSGGGFTLATSNITFYVAPTGSDSNPGTIGQPFATIGHAFDVASGYNWAGLYAPTIQCADGTYTLTSELLFPILTNVSQNIFSYLRGNSNTPTNCVITANALAGLGPLGCGGTVYWWMEGFSVQPTGTCRWAINYFDCVLNIAALDVGGDGTATYLHYAESYGQCFFSAAAFGSGGITVSAGAGSVFRGLVNGSFLNLGAGITVTGAVSSPIFISLQTNSSFDMAGTWTDGGVTGQKFSLVGTSTIDQNGALPSTIPGNFFGTADYSSYLVNIADHVAISPTTGDNYLMNFWQPYLKIKGLKTIGSLTVTLPQSPGDGVVVMIGSDVNITTLTLATGDQFKIIDAPTSYTAGGADIVLQADRGFFVWETMQPCVNTGPTVIIDPSAGASQNKATGAAVTVTATAPIGSAVFVAVFAWTVQNQAIVSVTDSAGNTYTQAAQSAATPSTYSCALFYSLNIAAALTSGVGTITVNTGGGNYAIGAVAIAGYNGGLDKQNSAVFTSSPGASSPTVSTASLAAHPDIIFGVCEPNNNTNQFTEASGFVRVAPANYGVDFAFSVQGRTNASTYNPTFAVAGNDHTSIVIAAFKPT